MRRRPEGRFDSSPAAASTIENIDFNRPLHGRSKLCIAYSDFFIQGALMPLRFLSNCNFQQGFDLISLDEDHEFHTVAHTMVGATFSLPRLSLCAHAKKRSSALLLFHRLKSNPRSLDFDPVFSAGISSPVPIPIPETRLALTSRVIFCLFCSQNPSPLPV